MQSIEELQQTSAAIAEITMVTTELSQDAKLDAASALEDMSSFLVSSEAGDSENVEDTAKALVSGISNVIMATVQVPTAAARGNETGPSLPLTQEDKDVVGQFILFKLHCFNFIIFKIIFVYPWKPHQQ